MIIRIAQRKDRENILKIASHTWEGWDYVPKLLDEWFIEGGLIVAEEKGDIIGITKTTTLSQGELWLEGIRVKEKERGKSIGKQLAFFQLKEALKQKPKVVRLSTVEINIESIKIIEKMGFRKIKEFGYMEFNHLTKKEVHSKIIKGKNQEAVWDYIRNSSFYGESRSLLPWSWIFREITPELISSFIREEKIFIRKRNGNIISLIILLPHRYDEEKVEICLVECKKKEEIEELFDFAQFYAISNSHKGIVFYPPSKWLEKLALKSGFSFPYSFKKILVYELVSV